MALLLSLSVCVSLVCVCLVCKRVYVYYVCVIVPIKSPVCTLPFLDLFVWFHHVNIRFLACLYIYRLIQINLLNLKKILDIKCLSACRSALISLKLLFNGKT